MKAILQTYKDRLINLSGRNRSLVLRKIHKKRSFDLARLSPFIQGFNQDLVNFLLTRHKDELTILQDPYRYRNEKLKAIEAQNKDERQKELLALEETINGLSSPSEEELQVLQKRKNEINEKYDEELKKDKQLLEEQIEAMMSYSDHINYLLREINAVEKETGKYELYLGYPFVEGRCNDGSFVRAPLFMFPVKLEKVSNRWQLSNMADQEILMNKVFIFAYAKFNDEKITDIDTEYSNLEAFSEDVIGGLLAYLEKHKIHIIDDGAREIETFSDYTNATIPSYQSGELNLKNYTVMGQFPLSNSIYTDYQVMEQKGLYNHALESLLMNKKEIMEQDAYESGAEGTDEEKETLSKVLSEQDIYFLSSLDHSQEHAVSRVSDRNHVVIYGPPGTGKSQTIANIICDALAKGKKVLMVSQKRAALDVIYNRLADINTKIALVHDHNKDKKNFYKKVCDCMTSEAMDYDPSLSLTINDAATTIDEKITYLELIAKTLHEEREFGISLYDMYTRTKAITSTEDKRYEAYRRYRKENPFGHYKHQELEEAIQLITDHGMHIKAYLDYKSRLTDNTMYGVFHRKLDFMEIEDIQDILEQLQGIIASQLEQVDMESFGSLGLLYKEHHNQVDEDMIREYAHDVNHKKNGHLIEDDEDNKWWNPSSWLHHKEIKEEKENNKRLYEEGKEALTEQYIELGRLMNKGLQYIDVLKNLIKEEACKELSHQFVTSFDIGDALGKMQEAAKHLDVFLSLKSRVDGLTSLQTKILDYAIDVNEDNQSEGQAQEVMEHSASSSDKEQLIRDELGHILEFATLIAIHDIEKTKEYNDFYLYFTMYEDIVREINELMMKKNNLTGDMIKSKWNDRLQLFMDTPVCKEFKRQAEKKRKLWPIRKYVIEFSELLMTLFPCWLLSPETVSDILPLAEGMFDMIIFDEASQMYVENAIPTIYRGKKVVVTGDDKQLKPSSTFMARYDDYDEEMTTIETAAAFEEESLLDLAKVNYPDVHLNYHYRSRYEELINFSNYAFYNGKLNISPNIDGGDMQMPAPIERIKVEGQWIDRTNDVEAKKVVDLVAQILETREKEETVGIITFNVNQKDLISDLLDERGNGDTAFKKLYQKEINRKKGNEDVSLFVKNIENVQGDERDIIIFSIGYAPNEEGRVSVNFGALSQDGGENRLNVAISRAKEKVYVITSIEPSTLKVEDTKNRGAKLFKQYLQYVKEVSSKEEQGAKAVLEQLVLSGKQTGSEESYDYLVSQIHDRLREEGYGVKRHVGVSDYKIDLALYDGDNDHYLLGIECDGTSYRDQASTRERDIHRKRFLESRGWQLMRVWSMDWWKNPDQVIQNIKDRLGAIREAIARDKMQPKKENEGVEDVKIEEELSTSEDRIDHSDITPDIEEKELVEAVTPVHPELTIWFGDKAYIQDTTSKEIFEIPMESNPYNKDNMSTFHKDLLGRRIEERFVHKEHEYTVVGIDKK